MMTENDFKKGGSRDVHCVHQKTKPGNFLHFYRAMLCISAVYAVMRCLSVCPSVCHFVDHVKMNKHIFEIFSP